MKPILTLDMAQDNDFACARHGSIRRLSTPSQLTAAILPKAETIHAVTVITLHQHAVVRSRVHHTEVNRKRKAPILAQQIHASVHMILAGKLRRLCNQNLFRNIIKTKVRTHRNGHRVFACNNGVLYTNLRHRIDLNRPQRTKLLAVEIPTHILATVIYSVDILIAGDITAFVPSVEQIVFVGCFLAGINRHIAIVQNSRTIRSRNRFQYRTTVQIPYRILANTLGVQRCNRLIAENSRKLGIPALKGKVCTYCAFRSRRGDRVLRSRNGVNSPTTLVNVLHIQNGAVLVYKGPCKLLDQRIVAHLQIRPLGIVALQLLLTDRRQMHLTSQHRMVCIITVFIRTRHRVQLFKQLRICHLPIQTNQAHTAQIRTLCQHVLQVNGGAILHDQSRNVRIIADFQVCQVVQVACRQAADCG